MYNMARLQVKRTESRSEVEARMKKKVEEEYDSICQSLSDEDLDEDSEARCQQHAVEKCWHIMLDYIREGEAFLDMLREVYPAGYASAFPSGLNYEEGWRKRFVEGDDSLM